MKYLTVKNWDNFQHYKDRNPPWIKLHRSLLDDYEFSSLPDVVKGQLMLIWVFASQNEGKIPQDAKFLERKLGFTERCALQQMVESGFLIPEQPASSDARPSASEVLADCKQPASEVLALARSQEERQRTKATETEGARETFIQFWAEYPRKVAKPDAERAWLKLKPGPDLLGVILSGLRRQRGSREWSSDGGKFIPHPATWINGRRWEDEGTKAPGDEFDMWAQANGYGEANAGH